MSWRHDLPWMGWQSDPREQDLEEQARDAEFCEQCERGRGETCPACGDARSGIDVDAEGS